MWIVGVRPRSPEVPCRSEGARMEILYPNIQTKVVKKASVWLPLGHQTNGPQMAHANVTSDLAHIHFEPQGKLKKQILKNDPTNKTAMEKSGFELLLIQRQQAQ